MKALLKKHWRLCFLSYAVIYVAWFFLIEYMIPENHPNLHIIHCALDDMIPFVEIFVIPYCLWFFYIAAACIMIYYKGSNFEFLRFALALTVGMSCCLIICMIFPNGLNLRPENVDRSNIFITFINYLHEADTPTNVFPSIHVYVSLIIHITIRGCAYVKEHKWIRYFSFILSISICISTVFIKQHSIIDVIGGIGMTAIFTALLFNPKFNRLKEKLDNLK